MNNANILVTGSSGLIGKSLVSLLKTTHPQATILTPSRNEIDLIDSEDVWAYFARYDIDTVFHLAAKVGGIQANQADQLGFMRDNYRMVDNLLETCAFKEVKKMLLVGSSCMYPKNCPQPMKESDLFNGQVEPTNEGYALAKLAGFTLAKFYHQQHGMLTVCPILCNVYGKGDHYNENSHVIPALIRKFSLAKNNNEPSVTIMGTGSAYREFLYVTDAAKALLFVMNHVEDTKPINVGSGEEISIGYLAHMIAQKIGYAGRIFQDISKPDGMQRKIVDSSRLQKLGFKSELDLKDGLPATIADYRERYDNELTGQS